MAKKKIQSLCVLWASSEAGGEPIKTKLVSSSKGLFKLGAATRGGSTTFCGKKNYILLLLFLRGGELLPNFFLRLQTPTRPINPVEIRNNIGLFLLNSPDIVLPI